MISYAVIVMFFWLSSDALLFEELIQNPTSGDRIQENSNQFAENILEADI